ncbi:hypothetical protein ACU4GI_32655 [Cupriavidus basilensis]
MKLLAIFAVPRSTLQRAIDLEASQGRHAVQRLGMRETAGKVAIHGADHAVMAVIGRVATFGHSGLLCVRPLSCQE